MKQHNIQDLLQLKMPCSNPKSCWGVITAQLFGQFNNLKSLNIYNMWVRNTHNYKKLVINNLNEIKVDGTIHGICLNKFFINF